MVKSNMTYSGIAVAHRRFGRIRQIAPMRTPI